MMINRHRRGHRTHCVTEFTGVGEHLAQSYSHPAPPRILESSGDIFNPLSRHVSSAENLKNFLDVCLPRQRWLSGEEMIEDIVHCSSEGFGADVDATVAEDWKLVIEWRLPRSDVAGHDLRYRVDGGRAVGIRIGFMS